MFIAHVPSGYILSTLLFQRMRKSPVSSLAFIMAGMAGALAPDVDMAYFYLIDHRQTHHHQYITHWPILWLSLSVACAIVFRFARRSKTAFLSLIFCLAGVLHLILDSFAGDIWWFAPFIDKPYALFTVPAVYKMWWLNFMLHWTFVAELAISAGAFLLYRRRSTDALSLEDLE